VHSVIRLLVRDAAGFRGRSWHERRRVGVRKKKYMLVAQGRRKGKNEPFGPKMEMRTYTGWGDREDCHGREAGWVRPDLHRGGTGEKRPAEEEGVIRDAENVGERD